MTIKEVKQLEQILIKHDYTKYTSCLSSSEDYGYFKSGAITYDEVGNKEVGYQIEYRFWDNTHYFQTGQNAFGVDIIVITSGNHRADLELTIDNYNIDFVEKVAYDFYNFVQKHNLI